jgi:hypothetical protein
MTTCTRLSDRMPDVALGRERWSDDEVRHLTSCEDCRSEWTLVSAGTRIGAALPPPDPVRVAAGALARVGRERARARARMRVAAMGGLAAAAAVALAVWGGRMARTASGVGAAPAGAVAAGPTRNSPAVAGETVDLPLPELDSLPAEVLDSMLKTLDEPLAQLGPDDLPGDDSGDQELARALAGLEG